MQILKTLTAPFTKANLDDISNFAQSLVQDNENAIPTLQINGNIGYDIYFLDDHWDTDLAKSWNTISVCTVTKEELNNIKP
ncbi:MAG: hypothetical protein ACFE9R_13630 [Candidatus Hermodarchaeota archaeon]